MTRYGGDCGCNAVAVVRSITNVNNEEEQQ